MMSSTSTADKGPNVETLAKRYLHFLTSGEQTDITLIVGKDKIPIKAHKWILTFGSSFFEELLKKEKQGQGQELLVASNIAEVKPLNIDPDSEGDSGSLKQITPTTDGTGTGTSTDQQMEYLVIENVEPDDFDMFLQFLYTKIPPTDINTALPLLICATKFNVPSLIEAAGNLLKQSVTLESALTIFQQAVNYKWKDFQTSALAFICKRAYKVLETSKFADLSEEAVGLILQRNELRAYDEMQVFAATIRWAHAECGRQRVDPTNGKYVRSVLELLLKFIRFPLMNASEFSSKVGRLMILTTEERLDILEAFNAPEAQRFSVFFGTKERLYYKPETRIQIVKLADSSASVTNYILGLQSNIMFNVNKPVWISTVGLSPLFSANSTTTTTLPTTITIKIKNASMNDVPIVKGKESVTVNVGRSHTTTKVVFKTPIRIKAGIWYTISAFVNVQGQINCQCYNQIKTLADTPGDDPLCFEFAASGPYNGYNNGQIANIGYRMED